MRPAASDGTATLGLLGPLLAALLVALVVAVDLGSYGLAVARGQAAADAAALAAAVAADPDHRPRQDPAVVARTVALDAGGDLASCDCRRRPGSTVTVVVRMPVSGIVIPRVWARSVEVTAQARAEWRRGR